MTLNKPWLNQPRNHEIKSDYSKKDYYQYFKECNDNNTIPYKQYVDILKTVNSLIAEQIQYNGYSLKIPYGLGIVEWRKTKKELKIDGFEESIKFVPIDMLETIKLWSEDEESGKNKVVVRHRNDETFKYVFRLVYLKSKAKFPNKSVYFVKMRRDIKRSSVQNIKNGVFDAFLSDRYQIRLKNYIKRLNGKHNKHKNCSGQSSKESSTI